MAKKMYIKASKGTTEKVHELINALTTEGVDEHEILMYFLDQQDSLTSYSMLKDLAQDCGLDADEIVNNM